MLTNQLLSIYMFVMVSIGIGCLKISSDLLMKTKQYFWPSIKSLLLLQLFQGCRFCNKRKT